MVKTILLINEAFIIFPDQDYTHNNVTIDQLKNVLVVGAGFEIVFSHQNSQCIFFVLIERDF